MISPFSLPSRRTGPVPCLPETEGMTHAAITSQKLIRVRKKIVRDGIQKSLMHPLTPHEVLDKYAEYLDDDDKKDLENYEICYFIRRDVCNRLDGSDCDSDVFKFSAGAHIGFRFEQVEVLGSGTFGICLKCYDHKKHRFVALKILNKSFSDSKRIDMETSILNKLQKSEYSKGREYILKFYGAFLYRGHIIYVTEILASDLYSYIKDNKFKGMPLMKAKTIGLQIAQAIQYVHECSIIHSDIKPENILFTDSSCSTVKLIDFGCSCFTQKPIYKVVQSLYYRAPEVIFGFRYGKEIDTWSFACVLFEMVVGHPLFPSTDENSLIQNITDLLGSPPLEMINKSPKMQNLYERKVADRAASNKRKRKLIDQMLQCDDKSLGDLIASCLEWLPAKRIEMNDIVEHPFFKEDH